MGSKFHVVSQNLTVCKSYSYLHLLLRVHQALPDHLSLLVHLWGLACPLGRERRLGRQVLVRREPFDVRNAI